MTAARHGDCGPLLARIDALMRERPRVIVAIDGMSASGKTALAAQLQQARGAQTVHMDDFFLQPHQRTPQRYAEPGGNVDRERFLEEVLVPLRRGEAFVYRPFDCRSMAFGEPARVMPGPLTVVEGAYSLHPALAWAYDLRVMLRIDPALQSARILVRSGQAQHERFMRLWVPMENAYLEATDAAHRCELRASAAQDGLVWEECE